jgi:hypothetical protein
VGSDSARRGVEAAEGLEGVIEDLEKIFETHMQSQLTRSWCVQPREERKARLRAVIELARIKKIDGFATLIAEGVIEDLIQGDWDRAEEGAEFFLFKGEGEALQAKYGLLWSNFVTLVRTFCAEHKRTPTDASWWSPGS